MRESLHRSLTVVGAGVLVFMSSLQAADVLPESPGFYSRQDHELSKLEESQAVPPNLELSPSVQFVLFPKSSSERVILQKLAFLRYEFLINSPSGNKRNELVRWNVPKSSQPRLAAPNAEIALRSWAVASHPEMLEIAPASALTPGYYRLNVGTRIYHFAVAVRDIDSHRDCFDEFTEPLARPQYGPCGSPDAAQSQATGEGATQ